MKWMEIKIVFESPDPEVARELISQLFMDLGANGVVITEPGRTGMVEDCSETDAPDCREHSVAAYLPLDDLLEQKRARLESGLERYFKGSATSYTLAAAPMDDQPWETAWKAHFHPVEVTKRLVVKPSWEDYTPKPDQIVIDLDPGMAFGTGAHPTTSACMELVEEIYETGDPGPFLDVGTGSGLLMITAFKLGAKKVFGCDNDPEALIVARENLIHNKVPESCFRLWQSDLASGVRPDAFGLVAANITAEVNVRLIPDLARIMAPGGAFVASGIMSSKKDMVLDQLRACRFSIHRVKEEKGWIGISARAS